VTLTAIKQEGEILTLSGRSQSNARVSTYMRNLESSGWMTKPDLNVIEAKGANPGLPYEFNLKVTLANPNAPKEGEAVKPPARHRPPRLPQEEPPVSANNKKITLKELDINNIGGGAAQMGILRDRGRHHHPAWLVAVRPQAAELETRDQTELRTEFENKQGRALWNH
jgi:Tfp pilus assembly protein PilN